MKILKPTRVGDLPKKVRPQVFLDSDRSRIISHVAIVMGKKFPEHVARIYADCAFASRVEVRYIVPREPIARAIQDGGYQVLDAQGVLDHEPMQPVYLVKPSAARHFDLIVALNYFRSEGGMVRAMTVRPEEVAEALLHGHIPFEKKGTGPPAQYTRNWPDYLKR